MLGIQASHSSKQMEQIIPKDIANRTIPILRDIDTSEGLGDTLRLGQADPNTRYSGRVVGTNNSLVPRFIVGVDMLLVLIHRKTQCDQERGCVNWKSVDANVDT